MADCQTIYEKVQRSYSAGINVKQKLSTDIKRFQIFPALKHITGETKEETDSKSVSSFVKKSIVEYGL